MGKNAKKKTATKSKEAQPTTASFVINTGKKNDDKTQSTYGLAEGSITYDSKTKTAKVVYTVTSDNGGQANYTTIINNVTSLNGAVKEVMGNDSPTNNAIKTNTALTINEAHILTTADKSTLTPAQKQQATQIEQRQKTIEENEKIRQKIQESAKNAAETLKAGQTNITGLTDVVAYANKNAAANNAAIANINKEILDANTAGQFSNITTKTIKTALGNTTIYTDIAGASTSVCKTPDGNTYYEISVTEEVKSGSGKKAKTKTETKKIKVDLNSYVSNDEQTGNTYVNNTKNYTTKDTNYTVTEKINVNDPNDYSLTSRVKTSEYTNAQTTFTSALKTDDGKTTVVQNNIQMYTTNDVTVSISSGTVLSPDNKELVEYDVSTYKGPGAENGVAISTEQAQQIMQATAGGAKVEYKDGKFTAKDNKGKEITLEDAAKAGADKLKTPNEAEVNTEYQINNWKNDSADGIDINGAPYGDFTINSDTGIYKAKNIYSDTINYNVQVNSNNKDTVKYEGIDEISNFKIPNWGINNWMNDRANYQKGIITASGEPAWWYFKIFFKFDTQYGLLGNILNKDTMKSVNTANAYLHTLNDFGDGLYYKASMLKNRYLALDKFVKTLSYISTNAPWYFKSIKGLDKANNVKTKYDEQGTIEIGCNMDAVNMPLMTLIDLYKFICYDEVNCREILPENLRKFDMSVVLFQTPLKYWQTAISSKISGKIDAKRLNTIADRLSFKLFTFKNCEFMIENMGAVVPGDINGERPVNFGNNTLRINYSRAYNHLSNEFLNLLFGNNGSFKDGEDTNTAKRLLALENAFNNANFYDPTSAQYKELVDVTEAIICDSLMNVST